MRGAFLIVMSCARLRRSFGQLLSFPAWLDICICAVSGGKRELHQYGSSPSISNASTRQATDSLFGFLRQLVRIDSDDPEADSGRSPGNVAVAREPASLESCVLLSQVCRVSMTRRPCVAQTYGIGSMKVMQEEYEDDFEPESDTEES